MAIPLSEILQAKGDADYAQGGLGGTLPDAAINDAAVNQYIQHVGDLQYNANRYLAEQHNQNLQNQLKSLNDVDFKDMLPADRDALMKQYASVLQGTANNFGVVRNPLSDPETWANLKAQESNFRGNLSQSQQDAAYLAKQQQFVQQHPEFNTPQYQQDVQDFMAAPVGQRKYFTVSPPSVFDPQTAYKALGEAAKKKYATSTTNGKYITDEDGEKVDMDKYLGNTAAGMLPGVDAYGRPLEALRKQQFDSLPANLKALYNNDYATFATRQAQSFAPEDAVTKSALRDDEYGLTKANYRNQLALQHDRQAFEGQESEADRLNRLEIAGLKDVKGAANKVDTGALGQYKNKLYHDMLTSSPDVPDQTAKLTAIQNNPNLTLEQKKAQMDAISSDPNNLPATISNGILQNIYGDNNLIDAKQAAGTKTTDGVTTSKTLNQKLPATSIIGNKLSNDGKSVIIAVKNNLNGEVVDRNIPTDQFYKDLDNIAGSKYAPSVSKASAEWLQKNTGEASPNLDKLHTIFNPAGTIPPSAIPTKLSTGSLNDL